ncbi:endonuclease [Mesonia sp. HuA40]|uniref:endonuclease n=1 Tax=Mesonia sp. HuA40 TaxID=2602761 RepID=UPI0011C8C9EB|nr:endonuclease [Mesonia sp. HuA40]TXK70888.1 T9SS type A sorting domain-containing protein [Mesonia sp. HuA40]
MRNLIFGISLLLFSPWVNAQLVINELDCDTPSIDDQEFVELKSNTPNFDLTGFVLVFFNGSTSGGNTSYLTLDLSGYTTDVNGILLIGSSTVSPVPQYIIAPNLIQNGADAVAIYQAAPADFPDGTLATTTNLIDALVYGTSDPTATSLLNLLGETTQIDENANGNKDNESIQLNNQGGYDVKTPTPRQLNDGSGILLNGIQMSFNKTEFQEGESIQIQFTTEQNVAQNTSFGIQLDQGGFTSADFTGNIQLSIPAGSNTTSTTLQIIDDNLDEGDEIARVGFVNLPPELLALNNFIELRIIDNDFSISPWGTPLNPTYNTVSSTAPSGYYSGIDQLAGNSLRDALQAIVADPNLVRAHTYNDVIDILKQADENPENNNQIWQVYTESVKQKIDFQTSSINTGTWNREHTFPRSRGGFFSIEEDETADGISVYWTTNADSLRHANSDAHGLRAVDGPENSARGNKHYGQYTGPINNQGSFKGDVARSVFFLALRYNGLSIVSGYSQITGELGDLDTLLNWHRNDPPDDFEMNRNNIIYSWQKNRNPFIDYPDLIEYIWGNKQGQTWNNPLSSTKVSNSVIQIYPNPAHKILFIKGLQQRREFTLYSSIGRLVQKGNTKGEIKLDLPSGIYFLQLQSTNKSLRYKIVVQ